MREPGRRRVTSEKRIRNPGDNGGGVTPVPIPNTEVKSSSADGTACSFCGRVGHCQDGEKDENQSVDWFSFSFALGAVSCRDFSVS